MITTHLHYSWRGGSKGRMFVTKKEKGEAKATEAECALSLFMKRRRAQEGGVLGTKS
jgi:hypothetical protein